MNTTTVTSLKPSALLATALLFVAALTASVVSPGNATATDDANAPIISGSASVGQIPSSERVECEGSLLCGIHSGSGGVLAFPTTAAADNADCEGSLLCGIHSGAGGVLATEEEPLLGGNGSVGGVSGEWPFMDNPSVMSGSVGDAHLYGGGGGGNPPSNPTLPTPPLEDRRQAFAETIASDHGCERAEVIFDDEAFERVERGGGFLGMVWWGESKIYINASHFHGSASGQDLEYTVLHECAHILQREVFGDREVAIETLNAVFGTEGSRGLEEHADCMVNVMNEEVFQAFTRYTNDCEGIRGESARAVVDRARAKHH